MRTTIVVVGVLACAGCRPELAVDQPPADSNTAQTESPEAEGPEPESGPIPALACSVEFGPDGEQILVAGKVAPIEFESEIDTKLVAYPAGEGEVLVAVG